jgi:4-amino-4-deoxy-L-arabinose transferase-like glycosyltransferase
MIGGIVFCLLAGIGVARIISTYKVFSQTTDEPAHLITGMEWLQRGTYTFEPLHPPLARVAIALGPYASGLRLTDQHGMWEEGNRILLNGSYRNNLTLARLGVLPFFLLATIMVWFWTRSRYGENPALLATLLLTTTPVILAHAGLATTDMALTATVAGALLAFVALLDRPTYLRCVIFGSIVGIAALSKFSALVFLPVCAVALLVWRWLVARSKNVNVTPHRFQWAKGVSLAALVLFLVIWAGYRFSLGSVTTEAARPHPTLDHVFGARGTLHNWSYAVAESRSVPAPAFLQGLAEIRQKNANGTKAYLLGHVRKTGWWYFFPVAVAVKTTIALLVLVGIGSVSLLKSSWREKNWIAAAPVISAMALLLVCMFSQINIGVRHILPIYPLFAIIGGVGAYQVWELVNKHHAGPVLVLILLIWQVAASVRVHPDYLAYFNEFAGQHPERILVDSDLDWGQDLLRLSSTLQQKHVEEVSIAYAGSAGLDLKQFGLPRFKQLAPHQRTTGWVAISLLRLKAGGLGLPTDSFSWLNAYQPVCVVGRSIRLYHVEDESFPEIGRRVSEPQARNVQ